MNNLKEYDVLFENLKTGTHQYEYNIDDTFFGYFNSQLLGSGSTFKIYLAINKQETWMQMNFNIDGIMKLVCSHCNEMGDLNVQRSESLLVKFGLENVEESDEVKVIAKQQGIFNVAQEIFDFIELNIPIRFVHDEKTEGQSSCNPDIDKYLRKQQKANKDNIDQSPWEKLKKIKFDNK